MLVQLGGPLRSILFVCATSCSTYSNPIGLTCTIETRTLDEAEVSVATGFSADEAVDAFGLRSGTVTIPDVPSSWPATLEMTDILSVTEMTAAAGGAASCHPGSTWLHIQGTFDVHVDGVVGVPLAPSSTRLLAFADGTYEVGAVAFFDATDVSGLAESVSGEHAEDITSVRMTLAGPDDAVAFQVFLEVPGAEPGYQTYTGSWEQVLPVD